MFTNSYLLIEKTWFDEDLTELLVTVSDGNSMFSNKVYIANDEIGNLIAVLNLFKNYNYGGLEDFAWGEFGYEYANGAFAARLHFTEPGMLYISTHQQTTFFDFKGRQEANEAKMHLKSEPVLLDNFVQELKDLNIGKKDVAKFVCI